MCIRSVRKVAVEPRKTHHSFVNRIILHYASYRYSIKTFLVVVTFQFRITCAPTIYTEQTTHNTVYGRRLWPYPERVSDSKRQEKLMIIQYAHGRSLFSRTQSGNKLRLLMRIRTTNKRRWLLANAAVVCMYFKKSNKKCCWRVECLAW